MKLIKLLFTVGFGSIAIQNASAGQILQTVSLTVTSISQNTNATSDGTFTNVPAPVVSTHTTGEFLARLAEDEFLENNWPSNSFPAGARLAIVPNNEDAFFGVVLGTNVLVNVSDIINFDSDSIQVVAGSQNLQTGLAHPMTKQIHLGSISFDDRGIGNPDGSLRFSLQGIITETTVDSAPRNGFYTEVQTAKMTSGAGDGRRANVPFVCTGSVLVTGKIVLPAAL